MGYVSAVYFSNWSVYEAKHFANNLPVNKVSHVFYAFMKIDAKSGSVSLSDQWADTQLPMQDGLKGSLSVLYALKKKNRSLKVVMSIGGWGTHDAFVGVMKKSYRIKNFVSTAISLVKKYKFDGIDIDWEYPGNSKEAMQMVHLLSMLRESLTAISPDLILTVAAPAIPDKISKLLVADMDRYLTFWNIMCYDFSGEAWSTLTGYHSNLFGANGANELNGDEAIEKYISMGLSRTNWYSACQCMDVVSADQWRLARELASAQGRHLRKASWITGRLIARRKSTTK
ncbi:hypothetical protein JCM33374_g4836 [Metschnikowia sp. JCM 33374]|nr:hypothetical protein JCM33374_g4836 [Metschnikowia sp. JCM 33374]